MSTGLERRDGYWRGHFEAMAGPCEVLVDADDHRTAAQAMELASAEAARIERRFSRYRSDSIVHAINSSGGVPVVVDDETANLLDYAEECYRLSGGRFDVTAGVLRRVWRFDGSDRVPSLADVRRLLPLIGWRHVTWERPEITLPDGMEIDFGGIGKEYAVDRCATAIAAAMAAPVVVNFGGDLRVTATRRDGAGWTVGVESESEYAARVIDIRRGGLATSGDARRYLFKDGVRYSHILDPRTGWPVAGAPHSVTVLAATCTEAGLLATLGLLYGPDAESFLEAQGAEFWCER